MTYEQNPQQVASSGQPFNVKMTDLDGEMRPVWDMDRQLERRAIARRAYELFEARGRAPGHDWEDWFRAKSDLHLDV